MVSTLSFTERGEITQNVEDEDVKYRPIYTTYYCRRGSKLDLAAIKLRDVKDVREIPPLRNNTEPSYLRKPLVRNKNKMI